MAKNWYNRTPQIFRFTAKFPKIITHDKRLKDADKELGQFFEAMRPLADKTLALLIQLPPLLHIFEGLERLRDLVPTLDSRFRYAVVAVAAGVVEVNVVAVAAGVVEVNVVAVAAALAVEGTLVVVKAVEKGDKIAQTAGLNGSICKNNPFEPAKPKPPSP